MEARHEQVKQDYERYQRLFEEKAVSQQQWEKIRSSMQEADASLAQLKAAYSTSQEQYQNTFIKAPFDGIVGSFMFDEGEMIQMGQPVVQIVNIDLMKAKLYIPDVHMNRIQPNQLVYGKFPGLEEQKFTGRIQRIDPAIDPMSRTIQVEVLFSNENRSLKSGMYGLFQIEMNRRSNTFVVPDNSIITKTEVKINPETGATYTDKTYFLYIVKGDSAELVQVDTGIESYNRMEIISGLTEGDKVIIVGQKVVKPGNKVLIIED
jgi:RND family efflux transporter MFP subunit